MKRIFCTVLVLLLVEANAQTRLVFNSQSFGCSYKNKPTTKSVYGFETRSEAEEIIKEILDLFGLEPNFRVYAASVDNAQAQIMSEERVIIYNQNFISEVGSITGSKWAAISILAHEVGHHVQGHTIKLGGSQPPLELEADKWSGFVLYKLGANLEQAKLAMNYIAEDEESDTHPAKPDRLQAIAVGWSNAKYLDENSNKIPSKTEEIITSPPVKDDPEVNVDPWFDDEEPESDYSGNFIIFEYLGNALFDTNPDVQIFINNNWHTPRSNTFGLEGIPDGNNYYQITGTLTYGVYGYYEKVQINNSGYINVDPDETIYLIVDFNMIYSTFSMRLSNTNY